MKIWLRIYIFILQFFVQKLESGRQINHILYQWLVLAHFSKRSVLLLSSTISAPPCVHLSVDFLSLCSSFEHCCFIRLRRLISHLLCSQSTRCVVCIIHINLLAHIYRIRRLRLLGKHTRHHKQQEEEETTEKVWFRFIFTVLK